MSSRFCFFLILAAAARNQGVGSPDPDAVGGTGAGRQIKLALQSGRPEGGQLAAELPETAFHLRRSLVRATPGRSALFPQPGETLLLVAAQPLAHSRDGGLESARRRFDALLSSGPDQAKTVVESVMHVSDQVEVGRRTSHGPPTALLSPQQVRHLPSPPITYTLQLHRGIQCTVPLPTSTVELRFSGAAVRIKHSIMASSLRGTL